MFNINNMRLLLVFVVISFVGGGNLYYGDVSNFSSRLFSRVRRERDVCSTFEIVFSKSFIKAIGRPKSICRFCCPLNLKTDISLFLYTKNNPSRGKLLQKFKAGSVNRAGLKRNYPTVIYIHGFLEKGTEGASSKTIREAYLNRSDWHNVIIVDWSELSAAPWYLQAVQNTRIVGKVLASFLMINHISGDLPISTVHMIGFSLGAHIAGFAGKELIDIKIPRITGLDPAAPLFPTDDPNKRLSSSDAEFVDIVHTNWQTLGYPVSIGDADFYPNYGNFYQPGCTMDELVRVNQFEEILYCSHLRAWEIFAESVKYPNAFPCLSCQVTEFPISTCQGGVDVYMGYNISRKARGEFYLQTNTKEPFGKSIQDWRIKLP